MDLHTIHQTKLFRGIVLGILAVVIILIIFQAGVAVGYRRALFSDEFGGAYSRMFDDDHMSGSHGLFGEGMESGHGTAGPIISINLPEIVVGGTNNLEKIVTIGTTTVIRNGMQTVASKDLAIGQSVIVLGRPDEGGHITADLIRVVPAGGIPSSSSTTPASHY